MEDIVADMNTLSNGTIICALSIYCTAIIHTPLFEIELNRHQHHQLLALREITALRNYSKSFVSFYDRFDSKFISKHIYDCLILYTRWKLLFWHSFILLSWKLDNRYSRSMYGIRTLDSIQIRQKSEVYSFWRHFSSNME